MTLAARYFLYHDGYHLTAIYTCLLHSRGITSSRRLISLYSVGYRSALPCARKYFFHKTLLFTLSRDLLSRRWFLYPPYVYTENLHTFMNRKLYQLDKQNQMLFCTFSAKYRCQLFTLCEHGTSLFEEHIVQ